MDEELNCGISQEEFEWFKMEYGGITPCSEYGDGNAEELCGV